MNLGDLSSQAGEWLRGQGPMSDVVISSRIRLARNLAGWPFLTRANEQQRQEITELVRGAIVKASAGHPLLYLDVNGITPLDRQLLVERHLISRQLAEGDGSRGLALSPEETEAVMVNEEDHLRVQAIRSGLQLDECWKRISELDDLLARELEFAFDARLGYLTACPTNLGTGLRVSVMLHLPALRITEELTKVFRAAKELHLAIRGLFGEGTEATGGLLPGVQPDHAGQERGRDRPPVRPRGHPADRRLRAPGADGAGGPARHRPGRQGLPGVRRAPVGAGPSPPRRRCSCSRTSGWAST